MKYHILPAVLSVFAQIFLCSSAFRHLVIGWVRVSITKEISIIVNTFYKNK